MRKVLPGDELEIAATTFNTFIDAARDFKGRQLAMLREARREFRQSGIVLVQNTSGAPVGRFGVLQVAGPIIGPDNNPIDFQSRVAVKGIAPTVTRGGRFAILLEPINENEIGQAVIAGACLARVEITDEAHACADVDADRTDALISGHAGEAQLLWVQPAAQRDPPEIAWAVARIGAPARIALLAVVTYRHKDPTTGCIFLICKECIGLPNQFDPDSPDIRALAGPGAAQVAGDLVALVECRAIPGFIEGSTTPAYFVIWNFPVDEMTLDEPVHTNTVHANVPPPQPTPDPDPCLIE
ncbi:MAG: hypothetical protein HBSAPP02_23310 [Phycisphaerae bacterium]|nr:MAG: hypothetical protein HBSAPP02_23310 [Phycisphaerae bacterium]